MKKIKPTDLPSKDKSSRDKTELIIVSGASVGYFRCMDRFLLSAARLGLQHRHRFIIYDLGLLVSQRQELMQWHPWCEWRDFDFDNYPPHVALSCSSYAWKPIIIGNLLVEFGCQVLWLDSASLLHEDLSSVISTLGKMGTYSLSGQSPISERCDPKILSTLACSPEILNQAERVAGVIAFDAQHATAMRIALEWRRHALIEAHIATRKRDLGRHNPEQALLSILLLQAHLNQGLVLNDDEIDISSMHPIKWMSSRHKVADHMPRWTDLPVRLCYRVYKFFDRINLRLNHSFVPFIEGLLRLPHDHYCLIVQRKEEPPVKIACPWLCYMADPFAITHNNTLWIFVESYEYLKSRGRLLALQLDENMQVIQKIQPIAFRHHVSFPHLLEDAGHLYMVPETSHANCIDLYLCEDFPATWRCVARPCDHIDAADSVVFFHTDRWWLLTSVLKPGAKTRQLCIFWSMNLQASNWRAHPINEYSPEHANLAAQPRAAGAVVRHGDTWLRPVQINPHCYGESMAIMQIDQLDEHCYAESPYNGGHCIQQIAQYYPAHHVSIDNEIQVWDVRDRRRWLDLFWVPANCQGLPNKPLRYKP
jgi:hypothetical protein